MGNGASHVNKMQCAYISVRILLMMDTNNMNKVITDRNNGAVKVMYIMMLYLHRM
jgi:hypothetical protein